MDPEMEAKLAVYQAIGHMVSKAPLNRQALEVAKSITFAEVDPASYSFTGAHTVIHLVDDLAGDDLPEDYSHLLALLAVAFLLGQKMAERRTFIK